VADLVELLDKMEIVLLGVVEVLVYTDQITLL